jgi:hypothetical protein
VTDCRGLRPVRQTAQHLAHDELVSNNSSVRTGATQDCLYYFQRTDGRVSHAESALKRKRQTECFSALWWGKEQSCVWRSFQLIIRDRAA